MRRILSLLLVALTALSLLAGCQPAPDPQTGGTGTLSSTGSATTGDQPDAEPVTLQIAYATSMDYNNYAKPNDKTDWPAIQKIAEESNVVIDWKLYDSNEFSTLIATEMAAAIDLPDMVLGGITNPDVLLQNGTVIDLLPLIREQAPNMWALAEKYPDLLSSYTDENGRMFAYPLAFPEPTSNLPSLALREDWLKNLGLSAPSTTEDLLDVLRAFRDRDPNGDSKQDEIPLISRWWYFIDYLRPSFGLSGTTKDANKGLVSLDASGNLQLVTLTPEYRAFVEYIHTLYEENLIDRKIFTPEDMNARVVEVLNSEDSVMGGLLWSSSTTATGFTNGYLKKFDPDAQLKVYPFPTSPYASQVAVTQRSPMSGYTVITKDCKDPAAAIRFMDYCFSEEGTVLANWGIEGDSFTLENGQRAYTDKIVEPEINYQWYLPEAYGLRGWLAITEYRYINYDKAEDDKLRADMDTVARLATLPAFPLLPFNEEQRALRDKLLTDISTSVDENVMKFIIGTRPMSEWDSFIEELKSKFKIESLLSDVYIPAYQAYQDKVASLKK